ncbi:hypothetical protein EQO05_07290 [Methanosarcina sp. MSH10X1]|nr:hypothetical protein EQO05_07290 [Methanosarcina sp. MSH10X1]
MEPQHIKADLQVIASSVVYGFSGIFFMHVKNDGRICCIFPASFRAVRACRLSGNSGEAVRN